MKMPQVPYIPNLADHHGGINGQGTPENEVERDEFQKIGNDQQRQPDFRQEFIKGRRYHDPLEIGSIQQKQVAKRNQHRERRDEGDELEIKPGVFLVAEIGVKLLFENQEGRQHVDELNRQIEELEMKLALSCLGAGPYEPAWTDELEQWEHAFFQLKMEVYTRLHPKANSCQLALYGSNPLPAVDFYVQLFQHKSFSFQAQSVWFRESFYNEETIDVSGSAVRKKKREAYLKHPWHPDHSAWPEPEKPGDVLWGVEFSVTGPCSFLFLKGEEGAQQWMRESGAPAPYVVMVENEPFSTPQKLHRKDFYARQAFRRLIGQAAVRDTVYKINREYNKTALLSLIMEKMEEIFRINLDLEIL